MNVTSDTNRFPNVYEFSCFCPYAHLQGNSVFLFMIKAEFAKRFNYE